MLIVSKVLMVLCEHLRGVEHLRRMSERSPEADIRPRCFNVAQVPKADLEVLITSTRLLPYQSCR